MSIFLALNFNLLSGDRTFSIQTHMHAAEFNTQRAMAHGNEMHCICRKYPTIMVCTCFMMGSPSLGVFERVCPWRGPTVSQTQQPWLNQTWKPQSHELTMTRRRTIQLPAFQKASSLEPLAICRTLPKTEAEGHRKENALTSKKQNFKQYTFTLT